MRVLILSCNTGGGHNSAAHALADTFESHGDICEIRDALAFWSKTNSEIISKGHIFVYRNLPHLFGLTYRFEETHPPKEDERSWIYDMLKHGCAALQRTLTEESFDRIICTHIFAAMMLTEVRLKHGLSAPCYLLATDYTCSPGMAETVMDGYFLPHRDLLPEFLLCGLPQNSLHITGIPIAAGCFAPQSTVTAKRQLRLPESHRLLVMMCGSMGCGPIPNLVNDLSHKLPPDWHLAVICGNNRRLYRQLAHNTENTHVVSFTTRVPLYLAAADLLLTKPGGLSITEAAFRRVPMIFIDAVPGCETKNHAFFVSHGYAFAGEGEGGLLRVVGEAVKNPTWRNAVRNRLAADFTENPAETIYQLVCENPA